jgi:DNA modification methylase
MASAKKIETNQASRLPVEWWPIDRLRVNPRNVRTHPKRQIRQILESIEAFGFVVPIVVDEDGVILSGHGRREAALLLKLETVSVVQLKGLSPAAKRAFMLAENKIASNAGWDRKRLALELHDLGELLRAEDFGIEVTGFAPVEVDQLIGDFEESTGDPADQARPEWALAGPVSRPGDVWQLGPHRLMCGNARSRADLDTLMDDATAAMVFTDPPYNTRISAVVGRGKTKHAEFAEASGEQSPEEFVAFLRETLGNAVRVSRNGSVHFVCMDWRHAGELIEASRGLYGAHLNTAIWVKTNAGQGSFYRSQHEQVFVFRVGCEQHLNNIELGRHGRSRTNVWTYSGVNTFRAGRMDDLLAHPTVKPVALVADAMKDCSRRGDIVLDIFCGSGTTILAAERVGRIAYGLEIEPRYVDVAIRRWQEFTRRDAVHAVTGQTFEELEEERSLAGIAMQPDKPKEVRR